MFEMFIQERENFIKQQREFEGEFEKQAYIQNVTSSKEPPKEYVLVHCVFEYVRVCAIVYILECLLCKRNFSKQEREFDGKHGKLKHIWQLTHLFVMYIKNLTLYFLFCQ